jgi:hypothetical protein
MQNNTQLLKKFRELFWEAFHEPKFKTTSFQFLWESLEYINSWMAGPLFSIYENGHCDYVFTDKNKFAEISNLEDFYNWISEKNEQYIDFVKQKKYADELEKFDYYTILFQYDTKKELIKIAYQIINQAKVNNVEND